jgi:biotin carboxyl carrier protein
MNFDALEEVFRLLEGSRVAELELEGEESGRLLRLRRTPAPRVPVAAPVAVAPSVEAVAEEEVSPYLRVEALFVGRFHLPQNPVPAGETVQEDQVLGAVESLGLMNAVSAPRNGRLAAIHVEDGQPVEYGQLLFEIE